MGWRATNRKPCGSGAGATAVFDTKATSTPSSSAWAVKTVLTIADGARKTRALYTLVFPKPEPPAMEGSRPYQFEICIPRKAGRIRMVNCDRQSQKPNEFSACDFRRTAHV